MFAVGFNEELERDGCFQRVLISRNIIITRRKVETEEDRVGRRNDKYNKVISRLVKRVIVFDQSPRCKETA